MTLLNQFHDNLRAGKNLLGRMDLGEMPIIAVIGANEQYDCLGRHGKIELSGWSSHRQNQQVDQFFHWLSANGSLKTWEREAMRINGFFLGVCLVLNPGSEVFDRGDRSGAQPLVGSVEAAGKAATDRQPATDSRPAVRRPARLIKLNAIPTLEVDGAPFLLIGAQCDIWRSTRQDEKTVVEDPQARNRYGAALYSIRWAAIPIARARGTENLAGWFALRDIASDATTDVFGNLVPVKPDGSILRTNRWFVRVGRTARVEARDRLALAMGELRFDIRDATAGILVRLDSGRVVLAAPKGNIAVEGPRPIQATRGRFDGDQWRPDGTFAVDQEANHTLLKVNEPTVLQLTY
jgi:hypothetical protein